jgi:hypothetical protein
MLGHIQNLLAIPGARVEFGGKALKNHSIPEVYGAMEPTAVFVPLKEILSNDENFALATTEISGPLQVSWQLHMNWSWTTDYINDLAHYLKMLIDPMVVF